MNERWTLETAPSVDSPEAAIRAASWEEAQPWCNFVLLAPSVLPPGTTLEAMTLRPEAPPGRVEGAAPDGRPDWSSANRSCFRFEIAGAGRRLRVKEFLYDWAPAAFDHPSLWKSRNRGFPVGAHIGWIGLDFRKRPGASLHVERTMTELSVVEGAFSDEELQVICRGLAPAVPRARELIARTSLADLSYAARHVERIIEVPVGYFRHHRSQPLVPVTLFEGEDAPPTLPGRSIRPPDDTYRL